MKVLVFGSLNIDKTYKVDHIARPGETISASGLELFAGGKGLNQAIAIKRAGVDVAFAGAIGYDGAVLSNALKENGIDDAFVEVKDAPSGHAIIQVDQNGQNSIMILSGSNGMITDQQIEKTLQAYMPGDMIVLQNEINNMKKIMKTAKERGMIVCYNPSPMNADAVSFDFHDVDILFVNENEGKTLTGFSEPQDILNHLNRIYPHMEVVLTLGECGSLRAKQGQTTFCKAFEVNAVDTTAAGDTYTGYYIAGIVQNMKPEQIMRYASIASGIAVTKKGAVPSIPFKEDVTAKM